MNEELMNALNDFDAEVRDAALNKVAVEANVTPATMQQVNMHCHSFFSYNGYNASPARIVCEAKMNDWFAVGLCDFDVLDGLPEFIHACNRLGVRGVVNMETRTYFAEYADKVINSPGEPGVYYFMGAGFSSIPMTGAAAKTLASMCAGAASRNRDMLERINSALDGFSLDYLADVLPLTPNGNATERHLCSAFYAKTIEFFDRERWCDFWARNLKVSADTMLALYSDEPEFGNLCRSKLMKYGGPGYVEPDSTTFPPLDVVIDMILECDAIPMATWLDGTSAGESNLAELLECQIAKGVAALNVVPDRNWNLSDPDDARKKSALLIDCVATAEAMDLPVNVGTELNKFGQPWIDDFAGGPMPQLAHVFVKGAKIMVGHSTMLTYTGNSYVGEWAASEFKTVGDKNSFFASVGALPVPDAELRRDMLEADADANLSRLADAAARGAW